MHKHIGSAFSNSLTTGPAHKVWASLLVVLLDLRSWTNVNTHEIFASDRFEKAHRDLSKGSILAFSFSAPSAVIPTDTAVEADAEAEGEGEGGDGDSMDTDGEVNEEEGDDEDEDGDEDEDEDEDESVAEKNNSE